MPTAYDGITIPSYPNKANPPSPHTNVFAQIAFIALERPTGQGRLVFNIYLNQAAADAGGVPIDQIAITLGQVLVPAIPANPSADPPVVAVPAVMFPSFAQMQANPTFVTAFQAVGALLQEASLAHPILGTGTLIPVSES